MNPTTEPRLAGFAVKAVMVVASAVLLASCGGEQHGDLKADLDKLTRDLRGNIKALPAVTPYQPVPYKADKDENKKAIPDPFRPSRLEVVKAGSAPVQSAASARLKREEDRAKEPLESFPLDAIQMQGTLTQGKETFALVKAGANLYRVRKGNYMGQNYGLITAIDEGQISLLELVSDGSGEMTERESKVQLGARK